MFRKAVAHKFQLKGSTCNSGLTAEIQVYSRFVLIIAMTSLLCHESSHHVLTSVIAGAWVEGVSKAFGLVIWRGGRREQFNVIFFS